MNTLGLLTKWVESLDFDYEILSSCNRIISPRSTCNQCVTACPKEAISFVKGKPYIRKEKCIQCAVCLSACPVQAIAGIYPRRTIIQNQLLIEGKIKPTVKELLILYKKGIKVIAGETQILIESWNEPVEEANRILEKLGEHPFSIVIKSLQKEEHISRRELFALWKTEGKSVLKEAAPAKWRFNQKDLDLPKYYPDYQFVRITVNRGKCTLCRVCEKICKKNCFNIHEDQCSINAQSCTNCQLCADSCPEKAIIVEEHVSKARGLNFPIYERVCQTCYEPFHSLRELDEKCPPCMMREKYINQ